MHLILSPSDICYLTGVRSHDVGEIMILLEATKPIIFCDMRTSGLFDSEHYRIIDDRGQWKEELKRHESIEVDPEYLTISLKEKLEQFGPKFTMKASPITKKRIIKTPEEIQKLRISQQKNKNVYQSLLPSLQVGVTEREVAHKIQIIQLEQGATGPSFPPIVAFGEHSAIPHHSPTERALKPGESILLDMGLIYDGYCSDMTRMVYQENLPEEARIIGELVTDVTQEIIRWAKPGMKIADIDKKSRTMLGKYETYFTHSLGHGVGIDIHEAPGISSKSDEILQEGMVITIEPGIYIPGKYGARYEEMCFVLSDKISLL